MSRFRNDLLRLSQAPSHVAVSVELSNIQPPLEEAEAIDLANELKELLLSREIERFDLSKNNLPSSIFAILARTIKVLRIHELILANNNIEGEEGAEAIAEILKNQATLNYPLFSLDISDNPLDEEALTIIFTPTYTGNLAGNATGITKLTLTPPLRSNLLLLIRCLPLWPITHLAFKEKGGRHLPFVVAKELSYVLPHTGITRLDFMMELIRPDAVEVKQSIDKELQKNQTQAAQLYAIGRKVIKSNKESDQRSLANLLAQRVKPFSLPISPSRGEPLMMEAIKAKRYRLIEILITHARENQYMSALCAERDLRGKRIMDHVRDSTDGKIRAAFGVGSPVQTVSWTEGWKQWIKTLTNDMRFAPSPEEQRPLCPK